MLSDLILQHIMSGVGTAIVRYSHCFVDSVGVNERKFAISVFLHTTPTLYCLYIWFLASDIKLMPYAVYALPHISCTKLLQSISIALCVWGVHSHLADSISGRIALPSCFLATTKGHRQSFPFDRTQTATENDVSSTSIIQNYCVYGHCTSFGTLGSTK
jgi:hypothetical protein